jgi:hypothetical protein
MNGQHPMYDRALLLGGAKREAVLELWEVQRYGSDSYGDADYVSIYGMRPAHWHAKGVRVLGRTAVECTRDALADAIGRDVAAIAATRRTMARTLVVDPFAGSGNTLYWLLRHLPGTRGIGFELDAGVFRLTQQNVATLALPIEVRNVDYVSGLGELTVVSDEELIAFIAPPWGDALSMTSGLDLRRTIPPVTEIVDTLLQRFPQTPLLCVVQVYETVLPISMAKLRARFDWSTQRLYELNAPGQNHGILVGAKHWTPETARLGGAAPSLPR